MDRVMDEAYSYISERLRQSGNTVQMMLDQTQIPKPTFFRQKKTGRFSARNLRLISEYLELNEQENAKLFSLANLRPSSLRKDERNQIRERIHDLFFSPYAEFQKENILEHAAADFLLLRPDSQDSLTARQLAQSIQHTLNLDETDKSKAEFVLNIYGCVSEFAVTTLADMVLNLTEVFYAQSSEEKAVRVTHFVDFVRRPIIDKLDILKAIVPFLSAVPDYRFFDHDLRDFPWAGVDFCVLKCKVGGGFEQGTERYYILNIDRHGLARVYMTSEKLLYDFFSAGTDEQMVKRFCEPSAIDLSEFLCEGFRNHPKILLTYDMCFDNIIPENWDMVVKGIAQLAATDPAMMAEIGNQICRATDPFSKYRRWSNLQIIEKLRDVLVLRHAVCEEMEACNILSPAGLEQFAHTGQMLEAHSLQGALKFEGPQIRTQLEYFRDRLGTGTEKGRERYFLLKRDYLVTKQGILVLKGFLTFLAPYSSSASLYSPAAVEDVALSDELYGYFSAQIANRGTEDSVLMSDVEAASEIERLLAGTS